MYCDPRFRVAVIAFCRSQRHQLHMHSMSIELEFKGVGMWLGRLALLMVVVSVAAFCQPALASEFDTVERQCPVGGETFEARELLGITIMGTLPDGMPIGSGDFPIELPQCPGNGLVIYREFASSELPKLGAFVQSAEYKAIRRSAETPYYLAYRIAKVLGDLVPERLLLSATWEAKNNDGNRERARRYNAEFVAAMTQWPVNPADFSNISLHARGVNALRELGRFDEAENVRAALAGLQSAKSTDNEGTQKWDSLRRFLARLKAPILRGDASRFPIDMLSGKDAAELCLGEEFSRKLKLVPPAPLSAFEHVYCARPELGEDLRERRAWINSIP